MTQSPLGETLSLEGEPQHRCLWAYNSLSPEWGHRMWLMFYFVPTFSWFQWFVMCQPTRASGKVGKLLECPSLPSECRSELLSQRHCLWLVTHAGSSMRVAWCQDDHDNQKKWHGPCCQSSSSHRWPKQNHLKTVFWSYGTRTKTEYLWQEDLPLGGGGWLKWDMSDGDALHLDPMWVTWMSVFVKSDQTGTSLVAQWLRLCLPVQGVQVWSLIG